MALLAILPELVMVGILMATGTIPERHPGKFLEFCPVDRFNLMALFTGDFFMFSSQRILCIFMTELFRRFEFIHTMAIRTISRKCVLVIIHMA